MAAIFLLLVCVCAISYYYMHNARLEARLAASELAECRQLASQIATARNRPTMAAEHEHIAEEISELIEQSAISAGLSTNNIVRIIPEPSYRLDNIAYKEKPTRVFLKNITIGQLINMTQHLSNKQSRLLPKTLRLSAPREDTGYQWSVEMVLAYLVYDPPINQ